MSILWIAIFIIVISIVLIVCDYFWGINGIQVIYVSLVLFSQIALNISVTIMGYETIIGSLLYSFLYLSLDVINENYGKEESKKTVWLGVISLLLMLFITTFISNIADINELSKAFGILFEHQARYIIVDILSSYLAFQLFNIFVYAKLKKKFHGERLAMRCFISTIVSQIGTAIVFYELCFWDTMSQKNIFIIISSGMIFKILIALIEIPIIQVIKATSHKYPE